MRTGRSIIVALLAVASAAGAEPAPAPAPAADPAVAAWDAEVSDIDKLRTPDAPAFVILGVAPTDIQHPTTPTDLAIALGGVVTDGDLEVPSSLAIEVAPYWLFHHPELTVQGYRGEHLLRPLRTLSLSLATTHTQRADPASPTVMHDDADIGLGFRTMLLQWGDEDACTVAARQFADDVNRGMLFTPAENQELAGAGPLDSEAWKARRAEIEQRKQAVITNAEAGLNMLQNDTCLGLAASTTGFTLAVAGALDVHVADAKLTRAATTLPGYALWTTLSYDTSQFSAIALARYSGRDDAMQRRRLLDAGLRGIFKRKHYGLSAEALVRNSRGDSADTTYRLALGVEYELTSDTWLLVAFGKGYAVAASDAGSWFSLANLQWSFGKPSF